MSAIERYGGDAVEIRVGEALFRLSPAAAQFVRAASAENTRRAYSADLADFVRWCERRDRSALPAAPDDIANYLADLAVDAEAPATGATGDGDGSSGPRRAVATIRRRVAAIRMAHKAAGLVDPTSHVLVEQTLDGIVRTFGSSQARAEPLTQDLLVRAVQAIDASTLRGLRDRALLLVGFAGAFRRSELVSLRVEDLAATVQGIVVTVRRSKTDQHGRGLAKALPYVDGPRAVCPARALQDWLGRTGMVTGPIFRGFTRSGDVRAVALHPGEVNRIVKRAVAAIGLDPA